jgi:MFS family permease
LLKLQNVFVKKQHDKSLLGGLKYILKGPTPLKLSLMGEIAAAFFSGMLNPFVGIYQVDIKMATVFIFAWVNVAEPAVDILFSLPAARFIGRFGRRKMAYLGHIIGICGRVLLVLIPSSLPQLLILYSVLGSVEGCLYLGFDAYSQEIIPQDVRGKWVGIRNTIIGTMGIFAPVLGGFLWTMNPDYLFWLQVVHWTIIAFPIMIILMEKYSTDGRVVSGN